MPFQPSWEQNPENLFIGIEQEHFIFNQDGTVPSVEQMQGVFLTLISMGFAARKFGPANRILQVNRDVSQGFITVKNDYCTHIIEISLPPIHQNDEGLDALFESTLGQVTEALKSQGLSIRLGAWLDDVPHPFVRKTGLMETWLEELHTKVKPAPLANQYFAAKACATQVHLNVLNDEFYKNLSRFYALEYLVPLLFSESPSSNNQMGKVHCSRPFLYEQSIPQEYYARCIPVKIPNSAETYEKLIKSTASFHKDFSYISPRDFGSVEFRIADSQRSLDRVLDLIALRMMLAVAASNNDSLAERDISTLFYETSRTGQPDSNIYQSDRKVLEKAITNLPKKWRARCLLLLDLSTF